MYTIIGGDGQQYGQVSDADLRKWISEGRLNAQSLAKPEGQAEFRPLSTFPEFAGALASAAAAFGVPAASFHTVDWSSRDYELDIGGCISRGWNLFANNVGILLGNTLLYFLMLFIVGVIVGITLGMVILVAFPQETTQTVMFQFSQNFVVRIVCALAAGPLTGGLYYIFIRTMRGQPAGVGELFIGFQKMFSQLFLGYLVYTIIGLICFAPFIIAVLSRVTPLLAHFHQFQHGPVPPAELQNFFHQIFAAYVGSLPVFLVCLIPAIYLLINLQFTIPLIIDKEIDVWTALKTSWRMVHKHWFSVFGVDFLAGLIILAGLPLCCVGVFFTFAIAQAAIVYAYETIFGERSVSK